MTRTDTLHSAHDDVAASNTDARRMLDRYIEAEARGKSNATIRRYVKVALQFANEVQHQRTADLSEYRALR